MSVGDVFKVTSWFVVDEIECTVNQHYKETVSGSSIHPASLLVQQWADDVKVPMLGVMSNTVKVSHSEAHRVEPSPHEPGLAIYDESFDTGSLAPPVFPANVSLLVLLRTTLGSGRHNGRLYIPGIPEGQWDGGQWLPGFLSGPCADLADALLLHLAVDGYEFAPCVLQRWTLGVPEFPAIPNLIDSVEFSQKASGIRRRTARQKFVE